MLFPQNTDGFFSLAERFWPIGSIFMSVLPTNPVDLIGFGVWQSFGAGRCLVGVDAGDTDFDAAEKVIGTKTVTLTGPQSGIASHSHGITDAGHTHTQNAHGHSVTDPTHNHTQNSHTHPSIQVQGGTTASTTGTHIMTSTATGGSSRAATSPELANAATATNQAAATGVTVNNATAVNQSATTGVTVNSVADADAAQSHSNLQPSIAVYLWKRTA